MDSCQPLLDFAKIAFGAGVGTAAVTGLLTLYREQRHRSDLAAYMAMRLAVTLESYARACANFIHENGNAQHPPDERYPQWTTGLPELAPYPDDAEGWRTINRELAGRCLNLRNKIHESQGVIDSTAEFSLDDLEDTLDGEADARGVEAWNLANALRRKHKIEDAEMVWNYVKVLVDTLHNTKVQQEEKTRSLHEYLQELRADDERAERQVTEEVHTKE